MWWLSLLACSGGSVEPDPTAPRPLPDLPATWSAVPEPAGPVLKAGDKTCKAGSLRFSWKPDLSFEVANPKAKFGGTWRDVDEALVYLTKGPIGPHERCTAARFLPDVLLCAEGPIGCAEQPYDWAIEVVDDGAGALATETVARVLTRVEGAGVVFRAPETGQGGAEVQVRWRTPGDGTRRHRELAEQVAAILERDLDTANVDVAEDPDATSPVVVRVGGAVSPR
jgi:hypothetical protein